MVTSVDQVQYRYPFKFFESLVTEQTQVSPIRINVHAFMAIADSLAGTVNHRLVLAFNLLQATASLAILTSLVYHRQLAFDQGY